MVGKEREGGEVIEEYLSVTFWHFSKISTLIITQAKKFRKKTSKSIL